MKKCLRVLPALYNNLHHDVQSVYSQNLSQSHCITHSGISYFQIDISFDILIDTNFSRGPFQKIYSYFYNRYMFLKTTDISLYMYKQLTRYVYTSCQLEISLPQFYMVISFSYRAWCCVIPFIWSEVLIIFFKRSIVCELRNQIDSSRLSKQRNERKEGNE